MPNRKIATIYNWALFCSLAAFVACANVVIPSGGEKDSEPPYMVSSRPPNKKTNHTSREIVIEFNEYFKLVNPSENVLISPPQTIPPSFKIKGKKLYIELQDSILQDVTYILFFNSCIADVNEGNVLQDYSFVFSTGDILDSNKISGKVVIGPFLEEAENVFIGVYEFSKGDSFYKNKPKYISKCDNNGAFSLEHLSMKEFQLVALEDMNQNAYYDLPNERIGFYKDAIVFDSISHKEVGEVILFQNYIKNKIELVELSNSCYLLKAKKKLNKKNILRNDEIYINEYNDSIFLWILDTVEQIKYRDNEIDTIITIETLSYRDSSLVNVMAYNYNINENTIRIHVNKPVSKINKSGFCVELDSIKEEIDSINVFDKFNIDVSIKNALNKNINVTIDKNAIIDVYGFSNKPEKLNIPTVDEKKPAKLILYISDTVMNPCLIWLTHENEVVQEKKITPKQKKVSFNNIGEGKYTLYYIIDENNDDRWTEGDFKARIQAETISIIKKNMMIRENWTYEDTIRFSK